MTAPRKLKQPRRRPARRAAARQHPVQRDEDRFWKLLELSPDTILVHRGGSILYVNPAGARLLGAAGPDELAGRPLLDLVSPEHREAARARIRAPQGASRNPFVEQKLVRLDGQSLEVEATGIDITFRGRPAVLVMARDLSARREAESRLLRDALRDPLTGLANRTLLMDRLGQALLRTKWRRDHKFAVLFLDVDRFKVVNDSLGHAKGDQLLLGIGKRLEACLRPGDTLARLGGDEFAMLCEEIQDVADATRIAERIHRELTLPFRVEGDEVFATVTIGIALSGASYERPEDLLRDADTAAYRAKTLGKARHEVFDKAMHARAVALLKLETDLRRALDRGEFRLHYQPIVFLQDGRIAGFEALLRWQHPERGLLPPGEFLSMAEETGLIVPMGWWALEEACRQLAAWEPLGPSLAMSVNLSSRQAAQPDLVRRVGGALQAAGLLPSRLRLEITESVLLQSAEAVTEGLVALKSSGVQLHIDDFGTGYSSLSYLHRFQLDALKIDRSFVSGSQESKGRPEILRAIVALAHNLGMDVVAEGVETEAQLAMVKALQCQYAQGFLFSRAVDAEAASALIRDAGLPMAKQTI